MLNIDTPYLAVKLETVLEVMQDIRSSMAGQSEKTIRLALKKQFENTTVVTRYNNKIYRVRRISFDHSP